MEPIRLETWLTDFKTIILNYMEHRTSDPFMGWFRQEENSGVFVNDFERVLSVLIAARFDQRTTADVAFRNSKMVINCGALKSIVSRKNLPLLIPRRQTSAENWTQLFCDSQPKLHALSKKILEKKTWKADDLLSLFSDKKWKVPYLGAKTSRLAVRWLHEQIPTITIDMRAYKIPVDSLVYRVTSRLGIINPYHDVYFGNDSPADIKIQFFVKELFPEKPWIIDEPLWSVGRKASSGGHCSPTNPNCYDCMFQKICPKNYLDFDPVEIGMQNGKEASQRVTGKKLKRKGESQQQIEYAKFVTELRRQGINGELYREKIAQWNKEHPWSMQ